MLLAYSTGGQRSSRAISLSGANALIALPSKEDEGRLELGKGEMADAILIDF
jgi:gephyrin